MIKIMKSNNPPKISLDAEALRLMQTIVHHGSMAQAARVMGLVPSTLSYRVRQLEDSLDVLLFDRRSRRAVLTPAGQELFIQGQRILNDIQALAQRVKRVAHGWEPSFTIAVDSSISRNALFNLIEDFYTTDAPTSIRLRSEVMLGTWDAIFNGRADISIGMTGYDADHSVYTAFPIGKMKFVFAVAPHHPLANAPEPISDTLIKQHRATVVSDTSARPALTLGILQGQNTFTVPSMNSKIAAQVRGLGCGFLPERYVRNYLNTGLLVEKKTDRSYRDIQFYVTWRKPEKGNMGLALKWWLEQLGKPEVQEMLLSQAGDGL